MKLTIKIILINLFFLSITGYTFANDKTAYINVDYLIKNSNIGKRMLNKINTQNKINIDQLEKKNESLKTLENEIKNKKNIITEDEFNKEVLDFQKKIKTFNNEKKVLVKNFNDLRSKEIKDIFSSLEPVISSYMKDNSINILLDSKNIFMGNKEVDMTNDLLKKINNEIK